MMDSPRSVAVFALVFIVLARGAFAGEEKPALERVVPVPSNEPIPLTDFFRPVIFRGPRMNHAGTYLAAIVTNTLEARDLVLVNLESGGMDRISADITKDIYSFEWLTDDRILFGTSVRKEYADELRVVNVDHPGASYPIVRYNLVSLIGIPEDNRTHPVIWIRGDAFSGTDNGVVQVNALERLDEGGGIMGGQRGNTFYLQANRSDTTMLKVLNTFPVPDGTPLWYGTDKDGNLAFAITARNAVETLWRFSGDHWERCPVDLDRVEVLGAGDQPGEVIVAGPRQGREPRPIRRMDAATGQPGEVLYQDRRYDCRDSWLYRDPATRRVVGIHIVRRGPEMVWLDPEYQALQAKFERAFPGQIVQIDGSDDARRRFVVQTLSDVNPATYYLVDLQRHSVGLLKKAAPWLDPDRLLPMKAITYRARDGSPIEAFLTLPAGASKASPVPLLVFPHGGPWARDVWGYDRFAQFFASRGYAVLQPNYRGSIGYDWRFPEADRYDFVKMRNDVTDGTNALIRSGLVDRNRVAIMGGSFGGYLAICGAVYEPGLYRCAVTISGIFDWEKVMAEARQDNYFDSYRYQYFRRHLGDPAADPAKFDAISPLRHIDRVKIPIFVFHGWDDPIASIAESKALVAEMEAHGVTYEKHFVEREQHGISNFDNEVEIYGDVAAFLSKYVSPVPTAGTAGPRPGNLAAR
jgi:acetyl esterase/lipase